MSFLCKFGIHKFKSEKIVPCSATYGGTRGKHIGKIDGAIHLQKCESCSKPHCVLKSLGRNDEEFDVGMIAREIIKANPEHAKDPFTFRCSMQ